MLAKTVRGLSHGANKSVIAFVKRGSKRGIGEENSETPSALSFVLDPTRASNILTALSLEEAKYNELQKANLCRQKQGQG